MNFNMKRDTRIQRHLPRARTELARLRALPEVAACHDRAVTAHRAKIANLLKQQDMAAFFDRITAPRLQRLSRHLNLLNREMFSKGPDHVPEAIHARVATVPDLMAG